MTRIIYSGVLGFFGSMALLAPNPFNLVGFSAFSITFMFYIDFIVNDSYNRIVAELQRKIATIESKQGSKFYIGIDPGVDFPPATKEAVP